MLHRILILAFCVIVLSGAAMGQAKIGMGGAFIDNFLVQSPSVRANGMGEAGAALINNYSVYFNPANLGLLHGDDRVQFGFSPLQTDIYSRGTFYLAYCSGSVRMVNGKLRGRYPFRLNLGYDYVQMKTKILYYLFNEIQYLEIIDRTHNITLAAMISMFPEISAGVTWKNVYERFDDNSADGHAFDFGLLLRIPGDRLMLYSNIANLWHISPSLGLAWCNSGPDLVNDIYPNPYEFPLPYFTRFGAAVDLGWEKWDGKDYRNLLCLISAVEVMRFPGVYSREKYGVELGIAEAIAGRAGFINRIGDDDINTWGVSLKSRGMVRFVTETLFSRPESACDPIVEFFRNRLQVEFLFARQSFNDDLISNYYAISLSI